VDLGFVIGPRHGFGLNKQDAELVDVVRRLPSRRAGKSLSPLVERELVFVKSRRGERTNFSGATAQRVQPLAERPGGFDLL
jgi:hypothetical protein